MKIPTVTGLMDTSQLGYTLIHEHAVTCCDWSMDVLARAVLPGGPAAGDGGDPAEKAKAAGIDTIVDGTPINLGRDIRLIRQASERSGVRVIVSTGFYHQEDPWLTWKPLGGDLRLLGE